MAMVPHATLTGMWRLFLGCTPIHGNLTGKRMVNRDKQHGWHISVQPTKVVATKG